MIPRYSRPVMAALWSEEEKFRVWLDVELAVVEALERFGPAPLGTADAIRAKATIDPGRILELESTLKHDVIAFLTAVSEGLGDESRFLHYGMTSSDLLDTAMALTTRRSGMLVVEGLRGLASAARHLAETHRHTAMIGRSHGVHAEPTTFGLKALGWFTEIGRQEERLLAAVAGMSVGQVSGAVGTFSHLEPRIEEYVCHRLGLSPAPVSTQVLQRDRHAEIISTLAGISATLEKIATEIRNLQRTEILEVEEAFTRGQKGSSAMPHKRNPITCERVAGLARVLRGNAVAALENVALWHERDITHSSVERVIFPDSFILVDYQIALMIEVLHGLVVYPERMLANLERTGGLPFSQRVLLELTRGGLRREDAYAVVQENALAAWEGGASFEERIVKDARILKIMSSEEIRGCFNLAHNLRHVDDIFDRVLGREGSMISPILPVSRLDEDELGEQLAREGLRLTPGEARRVAELLERDPTRVEAVLFDTLWSEHCSYKSSRAVLKASLTTDAPHVILGPGEDAGVVYLTTHKGERWALVVAHESHNHPSQVVPAEGAATGIGGVVRDVYCMGAEVVGVLDGLRFGSLTGAQGERSREIATGVVDGIWHYGNALGVPNLGGDAIFDSGFDENCLVNVVAVGVVKEKDVVRSRVPADAKTMPYVFVLVGKPTDASGFGGAAFASAVLDEAEMEANKGAVQLPDPFLKRVLSEANRCVLELARTEGFAIGFKDLGAGGIACATSELAAAGGFGADIQLSAVSLDGGPFPPEVIACSETQERYCLAVPQGWAQQILKIYNVDYELPSLYPGARAQVVGTVRTEDTLYRLAHESDEVCRATVEAITEGIRYERVAAPAPVSLPEPTPPAPSDVGEILVALLTGPTLASREGIFRHYDTEVQGRAVTRPGEADAGVVVPVEGASVGLAVSIDGNPFYGELDAYQGGANAVAESMRNVAAVGATPWCLTDCLNYGNPEDPEVFRQFRDGVRGLGDAAREIGLVTEDGVALPVVSGNVSFYNQSSQGRSIPPSPVVACFGVLQDYGTTVTQSLLEPGNALVLIGRRKRELGGSAYWRHQGVTGGVPPQVDAATVRAEIRSVLGAIESGWILSCHDISEGGLAVAAAEMALTGNLGVTIDIDGLAPDLRADEILFCETGGFLAEVPVERTHDLLRQCTNAGANATVVGEVVRGEDLEFRDGDKVLTRIDLDRVRDRWSRALEEALR